MFTFTLESDLLGDQTLIIYFNGAAVARTQMARYRTKRQAEQRARTLVFQYALACDAAGIVPPNLATTSM